MRICISFDPGTNHTGYCVWKDGKPIECDVIEPPYTMKKYIDKAFSIADECLALMLMHHPGEVAVEDFGRFHSKEKIIGPVMSKESMMKCSGIQMVVAFVAYYHGARVSLVSKGKIRKADSKRLAAAYGISHKKEDPIDAFQIGICAGFDRKTA